MKNKTPNTWLILLCILLGFIICFILANSKQIFVGILPASDIKDSAELVIDTGSAPVTSSIEEPVDCESTETRDYIIFLSRRNGGELDLHIMDKNGYNHRIVMRDVSGSPEWSGDGKQIFIGCEHAQGICVLNAPATLIPCFDNPEGSECIPVIEKIYTLPGELITPTYITTSWSEYGKNLLVTIQADLFDTYIYFLALEKGDWQLIGKNALLNCDLSPISDDLICSGIEKINLRKRFFEGFHVGNNPKWSPDGEQIVFVFYQIQDKEDLAGTIMEWTFKADKPWRIIREPERSGQGDWDNQRPLSNIGGFSWSPDKKYITFSANYGQESESLIFRLDTYTGESVVLTAKLEDGFYSSPVWGYLP